MINILDVLSSRKVNKNIQTHRFLPFRLQTILYFVSKYYILNNPNLVTTKDDYMVTTKPEGCKVYGLGNIGSVEECKANLGHFQSIYPNVNFKKPEDSTGHPSGCYVYSDENSNFGVYFNKNTFGNNHMCESCRVLCKRRGVYS